MSDSFRLFNININNTAPSVALTWLAAWKPHRVMIHNIVLPLRTAEGAFPFYLGSVACTTEMAERYTEFSTPSHLPC